VAELSVNVTELSVNAVEFQFSERFMFLSHVKHGQILANFIDFFQIFQKVMRSTTSDFFYSARIFKPSSQLRRRAKKKQWEGTGCSGGRYTRQEKDNERLLSLSRLVICQAPVE
jgi:hypothetical protein